MKKKKTIDNPIELQLDSPSVDIEAALNEILDYLPDMRLEKNLEAIVTRGSQNIISSLETLVNAYSIFLRMIDSNENMNELITSGLNLVMPFYMSYVDLFPAQDDNIKHILDKLMAKGLIVERDGLFELNMNKNKPDDNKPLIAVSKYVQ